MNKNVEILSNYIVVYHDSIPNRTELIEYLNNCDK
jgi:hypothetical protein